MATPVNIIHSIKFNKTPLDNEDEHNKSLNLDEFNYTPSIKPEKSNPTLHEDMSDLASRVNSVDFK